MDEVQAGGQMDTNLVRSSKIYYKWHACSEYFKFFIHHITSSVKLLTGRINYEYRNIQSKRNALRVVREHY